MHGYYVKKLGENRGSPRVWLDGSSTERAGFTPGQRYDIDIQGTMIVLQANKDGSRVVSGKRVGEKNNPIIDINSKALLAMFDGMAAIRVVVKQDQIYLMPLASEIKKRERFGRLRQKMEDGEPLDIGSLSHGGGVLSHAVHAGFTASGIETRLAFANEINGDLLEHAMIHNDAWDERTQVLAAPMQELAFDTRGVASIPKVEILECGIPCSGASKAGRSKLALAHPESHPHVGHLVVAACMLISRTNPAIAIFECVPSYQNSASAEILRTFFRENGYATQERILNGRQWGSLENRDRWCMVGVTEGIEFDFNQLQPPGQSMEVIADVLEDIGPDDERWRTFDYLKTKEVRDAAKGNSFQMQTVAPDGNSVPTLRRGYAKGGSTDPLLKHPNDPNLLRQFTSKEHSRIKKIPEALINGLSTTQAHQLLGQSIIYEPFKGVGKHIGNALNRFAGRDVIENEAIQPLPVLAQTPVNFAHQVGIPESRPPSLSSPQGQLGFDDDVVSHGQYSGLVLDVAAGVVTQKISRDGRTAQHSMASLSSIVSVGEVVDIKYDAGRGIVNAKALEKGVER